MKPPFRAHLPVALLFALGLVFALVSCAKKNPVAPVVAPPAGPAANSATGVVQRFAWAWVNRDTAAYSALLTDDFNFQFAANDSAGTPFRDQPWGFEFEDEAVGHLLRGGSDLPPASDVSLTIDHLLVALTDPRPGKGSPWHRSVRTHLDLKITADDNGSPNVTSIQGYALFYVVRADSAVLTPARAANGGRDSTRWYIQRWEDESSGAGAPGLHPLPTRNTTVGTLKARFL
jgi:hypothetical protein